MEPLDCTVSSDGRDVMDADPGIECNEKVDKVYARLKYWSGVTLLVYGVGIPLLFTVVLVKNRKAIKVDQDVRRTVVRLDCPTAP
jgi:hypothetical protein